jgi:hypothetical protein
MKVMFFFLVLMATAPAEIATGGIAGITAETPLTEAALTRLFPGGKLTEVVDLFSDGAYRRWEVQAEQLRLWVRGRSKVEEVLIESVLTSFKLDGKTYQTSTVIKVPKGCEPWKSERFYSSPDGGKDHLLCKFLDGHAVLVLNEGRGIHHAIWRSAPDAWNNPPPGKIAKGFRISHEQVVGRILKDKRITRPLDFSWLYCKREAGKNIWACHGLFGDKKDYQWTLDFEIDASGNIRRWKIYRS